MTINSNGRIIDLSVPKIAGILNVTPDSFYDGGLFLVADNAVNRALEMINEGADMIDVGAFSSRPGAEIISESEELDRLIPVLDEIRKKLPYAFISVDTFRPHIAEIVVRDYGVCMINDISGGGFDEGMLPKIADLNVAYVIMHMKGTSYEMQKNPNYKDLLKELLMYFSEKIFRTSQLGINDILIDPGFGFGKTIDHNYELLNHLEQFKIFNKPLYVGISRKSMIYKLIGESPGESLPATDALHMFALMKGANILRVHDVKATVQVVKVFNKLNSL
jgi:dihydropteroate synthase